MALILPFLWLWTSSSRSFTEWVAILQTGHPPAGLDQAAAYAEGTPLDRNILTGLMVLAIIVLVRRGRLWPIVRANLPVVLFLLYGGLSACWSDFPGITIRRWIRAVGCLLMVMVALSERDQEATTRRLFVWAGFLLVPLSVLWIKYYPTLGRRYIIESISTWILTVTGVTTHKNGLGTICQVFGLSFVWHFLAVHRDRQRTHRTCHLIAHGAALAMVAWLFLQANSVTAQSSFLLGATFLIATNSRRGVQKRWLVHLLMAALVGIPLAILFLGMGGSAIEAMGRNSTLTGRTEIWTLVINLVNNPIVGTGFESFWLGSRLQAMQRHMPGLNEAHNGFLEVYISLGWIGVTFLVVMIVTGYRSMIMCFRRNPEAGRFKLALFLSVILSSFTEASFRTVDIGWIAFLLVTMSTPEDWLRESVLSPKTIAANSEEVRVESTAVGYRFSPVGYPK